MDEAHGLIFMVFHDLEIAKVEETLNCVSRVHVRGRIFNAGLNRLMVLFECKEALIGVCAPPEVLPPKG